MANCHEMRKGELYVCKDCGLELEVVNECREVGAPPEDCGCHPGDESGELLCCGKTLVKR